MGTKQLIRSGLMGSAAFAALGLTACANSHALTPGVHQSHYDYEGATCGSACAPSYGTVKAPVVSSHVVTTPTIRHAPVTHVSHYDYEGVPCGSCGTVSTGVISSGVVSSGVVTSHPSPILSPTYSTEVAPCPAGTTSQPDGTCLQNGRHSSFYGSSTIHSSGLSSSYSSSYSSGSVSSSAGYAQCPAGTSQQPDGTCLQGGGSSFGYSSSTYTAPSSTYVAPSSTYVAPELTTTCCGPVGSSSTSIYTAPATTSSHGGYATSGSAYSSSDYLPIRK